MPSRARLLCVGRVHLFFDFCVLGVSILVDFSSVDFQKHHCFVCFWIHNITSEIEFIFQLKPLICVNEHAILF